MGDRSYTRFSIPARVFKGKQARKHLAIVADIFDGNVRELQRILAGALEEGEAGYDNNTALRLVQDCPCLVFEDDDCNHAGSAMEGSLYAARLPFIRVNGPGVEYGPSRTVSDGRSTACARLDVNGTAMVGVHVGDDGTVCVDDEELNEVRRTALLTRRILRSR